MKKIRYDYVSDHITQKIFEVDSTNLTALMMQARLYHFMYQAYLEDANIPPQSDYSKHPKLNEAYQQLQYYTQKIEQTGFQLMPREAYQAWLKSLEEEKQKQQNKLEQERLQREIKRLKGIKSTIINSPKQ